MKQWREVTFCIKNFFHTPKTHKNTKSEAIIFKQKISKIKRKNPKQSNMRGKKSTKILLS